VSWLSENSEQVVQLVWAHLLLSIPAIVVSTIIAVPIAYFAYKRPIIGGPLLSVATLLYAIPALPLLALIPAFFGLPLRSPLTVVIALILYGIALLVRTAADAFAAIDPHLRDAAIAMGFSNRSLFWRVELPASIPVLLSGVRVVTVSTIGLATIGALVGSLSDHPLYGDLAETYRVPLLDGAWSEILGRSELRSDQIHANNEGYRLFAEKAADFLRRQGFFRP